MERKHKELMCSHVRYGFADLKVASRVSGIYAQSGLAAILPNCAIAIFDWLISFLSS